MQLPWRAAEAMHWRIGQAEMAQRANVPVFHLADNEPLQTATLPSQADRTSLSLGTGKPLSLSHGHVAAHTSGGVIFVSTRRPA